MRGVFIHGDSVAQGTYQKLQQNPAGRDVIKGGEGNQTLEGNGSARAIPGGDVCASPEQNSWGNDTIELIAKELASFEVYGGLGNDSIVINGNVSYSTISGDEASLSSGRGGNDFIDISESTYTFLGGDSGKSMSGNAQGAEEPKINWMPPLKVIPDTVHERLRVCQNSLGWGRDRRRTYLSR